jgi:hypothetical protein
MSEETVLKRFGGTVIYVTQSGKFGARIKGRPVEKRSLREIEKAILHALHAVTVMLVDEGMPAYGVPQLVKIAAYDEKKDVYLTETGEVFPTYRPLYHLNEEAIARFNDLTHRRQMLAREWEQIRDDLTPFRRSDLPGMQAYDALAGDGDEAA